MSGSERPAALERIIGVYHADGGLLGEVRYVVGKVRGTAHCALCDITHGRLAVKSAWTACAASFGVPVEVVHLNERTDPVRHLTDGVTPCVVAVLADGTARVVLDADALERCGGDVETFAAALREALHREGLTDRPA